MIYYPVPLNKQEAFQNIGEVKGPLNETERLCNSVLSLPMHTELTTQTIHYITEKVKEFLLLNS